MERKHTIVFNGALGEILSRIELAIGYEAFGHEVPLAECVWIPETLRKGMIVVPKQSPLPDAYARELQQRLPLAGVVVLVPGTRFDGTGTRRGRGGGWYDRFLAAAPKGWTRIGVTDAKYFSETPLLRAPHDEPMDFIMVKTADEWETYEAPISRLP